jgi:hypothetical protein
MPNTMTQCPRTETPADCPQCGARPGEECPLADISPELLIGNPVTAGATGVCAIDNEECESCQ